MLGALLLVLVSLPAAGQARRTSQWGPVAVGGSVGLASEAYGASGVGSRRPPASGRLIADMNAVAYGVRYDLDLLLSTEDDRLRQSMNRVGLTANYRELTARVGDFTPRLSTYSLNGTTLRGGMVEYTPRNLILTLAAGQARRSVDARIGAAVRRPAFNRNLFAARAGIGTEDDTHFHLIGTLARDVGVPDGDAPDDGTNLSATTLSPSTFAARPAENVTLTPAFGVELLDERLFVEGQVTASAFTRDTRASRTDDDGLLFVPGLFTSRVGSRLDYAGLLQARYTMDALPEALSVVDQMVVRAGYERIQPGFATLGRPQTRSDQSIVRVQPQVRLLDRRLQVAFDYTARRNNLTNDRNTTLRRHQVGLTSQAQLSSTLFLNASFMWIANNNDPVSSDPAYALLRQRLVSQTIMISPVLTLPIQGITHRFSLTTSFQRLADRTARGDVQRPNVDFTNVTATAGYAVILPSGIALNGGTSVVFSNAATTDVTAVSLSAGANYSFLERKLSLGLNGSVATTRLQFSPILPAAPPAEDEEPVEIDDTETSQQFALNLNGSYRLTLRDTIRLSVRGLTSRQPLRGNFQEIQTVLRIEHRF